MASTEHRQIIDHLRARLEAFLGQIDPHMHVCTKTKVEICVFLSRSHSRNYRGCIYISRKSINRLVGKVIFLEFGESVRIPDIIVGAYRSAASRSSDSPNSKKMTFPTTRLPLVMVVEITSASNRMNDILIKSKNIFRLASKCTSLSIANAQTVTLKVASEYAREPVQQHDAPIIHKKISTLALTASRASFSTVICRLPNKFCNLQEVAFKYIALSFCMSGKKKSRPSHGRHEQKRKKCKQRLRNAGIAVSDSSSGGE